METGTGKTYVYIRTIYELNRRYGLTKFIIVVPSVAIREGVKKSFESTKKHFDMLYDKTPLECFVYDSKDMSPVGSFATSSSIQVMIINIGAFDKDNDFDDDEIAEFCRRQGQAQPVPSSERMAHRRTKSARACKLMQSYRHHRRAAER